MRGKTFTETQEAATLLKQLRKKTEPTLDDSSEVYQLMEGFRRPRKVQPVPVTGPLVAEVAPPVLEEPLPEPLQEPEEPEVAVDEELVEPGFPAAFETESVVSQEEDLLSEPVEDVSAPQAKKIYQPPEVQGESVADFFRRIVKRK